MASWACSKCTFINPPSQRPTCKICLSSSFPSSSSSSSTVTATWSCKACTFSNTFENTNCEICGTGAMSSVVSRFEELDSIGPSEELDSSVGSVFLPLRSCSKRKNQSAVEVGDDIEPGESQPVKIPREAQMTLGDAKSSTSLGTLKILTYNVWFREDLEINERMKALGDLIQEHFPDVICFQEVTPNIYDIFTKSSWWKVYHCSVTNDIAHTRQYFCMQLSKLPVKISRCKPFTNSVMGRELCITELEVPMGKPLIVATSHLESPCPAPPKWDQMYSKERVAQAVEALNLLKHSPNVIFCGDMNWDDKLDGQFPLLDGWVDAWAALRPGEDGWTYDTKSNQMLSGNRTLQKRLDRFVCKLPDFKISEIEMIGMEAIPGISYFKEKKVKKELKKLVLPVLPSDHYGLLLTLSSQ